VLDIHGEPMKLIKENLLSFGLMAVTLVFGVAVL
jgi:hypothetical protein